jgi:hypothetical protein
MVHRYLLGLVDLDQDDPSAIDRLVAEIQELINEKMIRRCWQLAVGGLTPEGAYHYRGMSLRPLTPLERGRLAERSRTIGEPDQMPGSDFELPSSFFLTPPSVLLEIITSRNLTASFDSSSLPNRLALAFWLSGFELSSTGVISNFDLPRWSSIGVSHSPFPVAERVLSDERTITECDFKGVVELAYKIPEFRVTEGTAKEVALFRALRACGMNWQESGFLDYAIALEAALLGGTKDELAYKFRLYGALFLKDQLEPQQTFMRLKKIYEVRSNLVHGGRVTFPELNMVTSDAAELTKAILRTAVQSGWPDPSVLNTVALAD